MKNKLFKNKKGFGVAPVIGIASLIIGLLLYIIILRPDLAPLVNAVTSFWKVARWVIWSVMLFLVLWLTGTFKYISKLILGR